MKLITNENAKWATRRPKGFRVDAHTEVVVCLHRNLGACPKCVAEHLNILDVWGETYWITTPEEVGAMLNAFKRHADADLEGIEARFVAIEKATGKNVRNCAYAE